MNITDKQQKDNEHYRKNNRTLQKKAPMSHFSGPEVDEIFDTLEDPKAKTDYKYAVGRLTE